MQFKLDTQQNQVGYWTIISILSFRTEEKDESVN